MSKEKWHCEHCNKDINNNSKKNHEKTKLHKKKVYWHNRYDYLIEQTDKIALYYCLGRLTKEKFVEAKRQMKNNTKRLSKQGDFGEIPDNVDDSDIDESDVNESNE